MSGAIAAGAIRPDDWNLALFVHVLGAVAAVGALVVAGYYLLAARRTGSLETLRVGARWLIFGALPSFIVMRVGAQWIASKEGLEDADLAWIGIGFGTSDLGGILIIGSSIAMALAMRSADRAARDGEVAVGRSAQVVSWLMGLVLVLYVIAIWAMTTKPA